MKILMYFFTFFCQNINRYCDMLQNVAPKFYTQSFTVNTIVIITLLCCSMFFRVYFADCVLLHTNSVAYFIFPLSYNQEDHISLIGQGILIYDCFLDRITEASPTFSQNHPSLENKLYSLMSSNHLT